MTRYSFWQLFYDLPIKNQFFARRGLLLMKFPRKTPLALALASALTVAAFVPTTQAVDLSIDGLGEVAIAPYYTTRGGWQTLVNLTNVKNVPVVVKVRLHEFRNSRDVLDFNVAKAMTARGRFCRLSTPTPAWCRCP
jgi:hypothetical protein